MGLTLKAPSHKSQPQSLFAQKASQKTTAPIIGATEHYAYASRVSSSCEWMSWCSQSTPHLQYLLRHKRCEGAEMDPRAKFGKKIVAGANRRPKWVLHYGAQAVSGRAQVLRLCSSSAPHAHPRLRSKQSLLASETKMDQAKSKISPDSMGVHTASQCLSSP
jgi:hypothetical protein